MSGLLNKFIVLILALCAVIITLSAHPAGGAEQDEIFYYVPGDVNAVGSVDVTKILEVPYLREAIEEALVDAFPGVLETARLFGYELKDICERLVFSANFGRYGRRSSEITCYIIRNAIDEDTDIYAETGDSEKHAWIRWEREPEE